MRIHIAAAWLACVLPVGGQSPLSPPYRYDIREGGFAIRNGPGYFNRPLFGTHEPSMLLSGDRPAFAYFAPNDIGKIGTLYLGVATPRGARWMHLLSEIESVYQPGLTRHTLRDPELDGGELELTAVPLATAEGFALRLRWIRPPAGGARLLWTFGGASGYDVNKSARIDKLHLSPEDCLNNTVRVWDGRFSVTSPTMKGREIWAACDLPGRLEAKDAVRVLAGPTEGERAGPSNVNVAFFAGEWTRPANPVHLLFVMGKPAGLELLARRPAETFATAVGHYRDMARRVTVHTPDPRFDLAVEAMVIANDGVWRPPVFVHGAMSWALPYLGWRVWYGSDALGWHDRVRSAILTHAARQVQRGDNRGAIPHILGSPAVSYNMNEVFLDHIYHHYGWTGDRSLLASLFPVIEGILSWEKRRLDPDGNGLYENCLNTWISDSHWYSGGDATQASAYMYRAHRLAAEAAEAAGSDPKPWLAEAERIRAALNQKQWLPGRGHYAEFIDRIGLKRMHPEPELPTIYHPVEFEVADEFQAYQMLRFTETSLRNETEIPGQGRLVWSSKWKPNYNDSYTHSTSDLVYGEVLNLALAYYQAGQFEKAYALIRGVYAGMYLGGIPGGLSCVTFTNGQQRRNEEFADPISLFAKAAVEGVFGIRPEMQRGVVHVTPGFPPDWHEASIRTPDIEYRYRKRDNQIELDVSTVRPARVHYCVPFSGARVAGVVLDGVKPSYRMEAGVGLSFLEVTGAQGTRSRLLVRLAPRPLAVDFRRTITPGEILTVKVDGARIREWKDPQQALRQLRVAGGSLAGAAADSPGHHTLFVRIGEEDDAMWQPVDFEIRPALEIAKLEPDFRSGQCRFAVRNNTASEVKGRAVIHWLDRSESALISIAPSSASTFSTAGDPAALVAGTNWLDIEGLPVQIRADIRYWPEKPANASRQKWHPLDLAPFRNDSLSTVLSRSFWTTEYPYAVCCDYMLEHLIGGRSYVPNDRRLRAGVDTKGMYVARGGIPFAQRATGKNAVMLSLWRGFPQTVEIPAGRRARKLYLMASAATFPMQSHIANARVTILYADGGTSVRDLLNPENFDNGWGGFGGTYHYAANGMEVIGGEQPATPRPADPPMILSQHGMADTTPQTAWEAGWGRSPNTQAPLAPHADLIDVDCDPGRTIRSIRVEVLSNEIIVALLGATLLE